jgi:hypothetical protein
MRVMPLDENGKDGPLVKYMTKMVEWFIVNINHVLK